MKAKYFKPPIQTVNKTKTKMPRLTLKLKQKTQLKQIQIIGKGTFGAVFEAETKNGVRVAVKKVFLDPKYKNRELEILQRLNHPNCLRLRQFFILQEGRPPQDYLHIVTDMFPLDLSRFMEINRIPPLSLIQVFSYQIFRALAYLHSNQICHRDIKPSNVLVDPSTGRIQLCDFGSAKPIITNEPSVSYIATRSYRAPELLYGCTHYGASVDVWAAGCVIAEMLNGGRPLFSASENSEIIRVIMSYIGTPTQDDINDMNGTLQCPCYVIPGRDVSTWFGTWVPPKLINLLKHIFVYSPRKRITASQCLAHDYFLEVRNNSVILPNGEPFFIPN